MPSISRPFLAVLLPILAVGAARPAHCESFPRPVADLVTSPVEGPSAPSDFATLNGHLYFAALDDVHGRELWRTDGTPAGTELVADLCPGRCSSAPADLTRVDDRLFFVSLGAVGKGVWVTDGTAAGTTLAAHLPLPSYQDIHYPVAFRGRFYFSAPHPELGFELWVSDGSPGGTGIAVDVCPGACSSSPSETTVLGELLLFKAGDPAADRELWRSDGSPEGTFRVADICPGSCSSNPFHLNAVAGRVFFNAVDGVHGRELWVSDGTEQGTLLLEDFSPGSGSTTPSAFPGPAGRIYVQTAGGPGDVRFWRTDGTPGGAREASELLPYGLEEHPTFVRFVPDRLYFAIEGPGGHELRIVEGDADSSRRVAGPFHRIAPSCCGYGVAIAADGELAFTVRRSDGHEELWTTDGTAAGTRRLLGGDPDLGGSPGVVNPLDGRWIFTLDDVIHQREPWVSDGTEAGTVLLRNIHTPDASSNPRELTSWRGQVYFNAGNEPFTQSPERAAWRTAGPEGGVEVVDPDAWLGSPTPAGAHLFFTDPRTGFPMAFGDRDLAPVLLAEASAAGAYTPVGERVYFATHPEGQQVWVSDGTPEGTRLLRDVNPEWSSRCDLSPCPPTPSYPDRLTAAGERLFFVAASGSAPELWTSDGTTEGTVQVAGAPPPGELAAVGDRIVFLTGPEHPGAALWRSDGTGAGTRRIASLGPDANPRRAVAADGLAYFLTTGSDGRPRLWRTDGTPRGTLPLLDLAGPHGHDPDEMVARGRSLFFTAFDPPRGEELWVSDGTVAGTRLVADLRPGPASANPSALTAIGDLLLFAADDGETGHEPWVSDGTAAGTHRLADVHPGPEPSGPGGFAAAGDWVVFDAHDGETGREPWAVRLETGGGDGEEGGDGGGTGGGEPPPVPEAPPWVSDAIPGFRFWVRISAGGTARPARLEAACIPETACVSGAVAGRSELFLRMVGPKPNGRLWPTLVRFSTSTVEVWIEQAATGALRYYRLDGAAPGSSELSGLFDRNGFEP